MHGATIKRTSICCVFNAATCFDLKGLFSGWWY